MRALRRRSIGRLHHETTFDLFDENHRLARLGHNPIATGPHRTDAFVRQSRTRKSDDWQRSSGRVGFEPSCDFPPVQIIQAEEAAWQAFRRALRIEDRPAFDRIWRHVRNHAVPASMANRPVPMEAILMAMVVGLAKEVEELREKQHAECGVRNAEEGKLYENGK